MKCFEYVTKGVCSRKINFCIEEGLIKGISFQSGCDGNLQGIEKLVEGMPVKEVIKRLRGIDCQGKGTSCPDQLARAFGQVDEAV